MCHSYPAKHEEDPLATNLMNSSVKCLEFCSVTNFFKSLHGSLFGGQSFQALVTVKLKNVMWAQICKKMFMSDVGGDVKNQTHLVLPMTLC